MKDLAEQQERALQLLDHLLGISKGFNDETFKIRVQAQIANLLWNYDQERARRYLDESFRGINSIAGAGADEKDRSRRRLETRHLRSEVLRVLVRHDADAADHLLNSLVEHAAEPGTPSPGGVSEGERALISLELGSLLADSQPRRAVQLINNSLNSEISAQFVLTLWSVQQKDPALAEEVFANALSVAETDATHADRNICFLAAYLFGDFNEGGGTAIWGEDDTAGQITAKLVPGPSRASAALTERFLNFAYDNVMQTQRATQTGTEAKHPIMQMLEAAREKAIKSPLFWRRSVMKG